jgi:hypothetical protein
MLAGIRFIFVYTRTFSQMSESTEPLRRAFVVYLSITAGQCSKCWR